MILKYKILHIDKMEEHLIPYLPQGLTVETFEFLPEVAREAILTQAREKYEVEQNNNEYLGVETLMNSRIPVEDAHNYTDLARLFERYPAARFVLRMPSGHFATATVNTYEKLIEDHEADYEDQEGYDPANFRIESVLHYDEKVNQYLLDNTGYDRQRQSDLGGIDDVRFKIQEKYVPDDIYCPTNMNCVGKCIMKYLELNNRDDLRSEVEDINFDTVVTIPDMNSMLKKANSQIRVISYTTKNTVHYKDYVTVPIYKYEIKPGYFHAILILDVKKYRDKVPKLDIAYEFTDLEDLDQDALDFLESFETLKEFKREEFKNPYYKYAFDFETYKGKFAKEQKYDIKGVEYWQQPWLLQWGNDRTVDYSCDLKDPKKLVNGKFLKFLKDKLIFMHKNRKPKDKRVRKIVMFSFNGAKFDNHLFLGALENDEWKIKSKSFMGDETTIKRFSIKNKVLNFENEVVFTDVMLFFGPGMSLENACKVYNCKQQKYSKKDFDITDYMTVEAIEGNMSKIIDYGLQDIRATYEIGVLHGKYLKQVSETDFDMFNSITIANYSSKIADFYHPEKVEIYINPRDEICEFERNCVKGGRLIVGCLKYDKPSVAADINSMYPAGMNQNKYPTGKRKFYNRKCHPEKMEDYKNNLNSQKPINPSMMRVKFQINAKCFIQMLPVKGSDPKELVKTGDFSYVELQEAIKHAKYEILEVLFSIEMTQSHKIYEKFTNTFFDKRRVYKTQMELFEKQSDEYKKLYVLQDTCKLIMNSSYGSSLLKPFDVIYKFISKEKFERDYDSNMRLITIVNNQYFVTYKNKCHNDNRRPIYLGVFTLSFSKVILNNIIAALDGFFNNVVIYGDTDSVYVPTTEWHLLENADLIGDKLGQCKNDYGKDDQGRNILIARFRSLGKKMKMCWLNNDDLKSTIKGFKGLKGLSHTQKLEIFEDFTRVIDEWDKTAFKSISYETMTRGSFVVSVRHATRSFKMTAPDQYQIVNNMCYPLYYDMSNVV